MPSVQAVTDSPPATRSPMRKRQLKRTSSTASLPTPPPTKYRKRKRGQSRSSVYDTESEGEEEDDRDDELPTVGICKKRRTDLDALAASLAEDGVRQEREEDAFWLSNDRAGQSEKPKSKAKRVSIIESPPPLLLRSNRVKAPMSPPPSRRRTRTATVTTPKTTATVVGTLPVVAEIPVTPTRPTIRSKGKEKAKGPVRDTPHNPFLVDDDFSPLSSPLGPRTPKPHVEKPTLTYVFRGVKTTFANPLYELDPAEVALSLLPPEHPDFEPSEACPPKLLFPTAPRSQPARKAKTVAVAMTAATLAPRTPSPRRGRTTRDTQESPRTPRGRTVKRVPSVRKEKEDGTQAALKAIGPVRSTRKSAHA